MESLTKNYEFKRLYNKGKRFASGYVVVYCSRNNSAVNKLGITVSTKLGGAVQRNRIRRRLKEIYRQNEPALRKGYNIVLVARHGSRDVKWKDLESSVSHLFRKLGLYQSGGSAVGDAAGSSVTPEKKKI